MQKRLIKLLTAEDLSDDMKLISEVCGFETAKILVEKVGGVNINIPKAVSIKALVDRYIKVNRKSKSARMIALELNLNERTILAKMNSSNTET